MKRKTMSLAAIAALALGGATQALPIQANGRSPKEYGQWLQYNRKQKWDKSI